MSIGDVFILIVTLGPLLGYALDQAIIEWRVRQKVWNDMVRDTCGDLE